MHSKDDENYQRGYEWLLLNEAKKVSVAIITKVYNLLFCIHSETQISNYTPSLGLFQLGLVRYLVVFIIMHMYVHVLILCCISGYKSCHDSLHTYR